MLNVIIQKGEVIDISNRKPSIYKELGFDKIIRKLAALKPVLRVKFTDKINSDFEISKVELLSVEQLKKILKTMKVKF